MVLNDHLPPPLLTTEPEPNEFLIENPFKKSQISQDLFGHLDRHGKSEISLDLSKGISSSP